MRMSIFICAIAALLTFGACTIHVVDNKEINGEMVEKTFDIKDFNSILATDYSDIVYTVGDTFSVRVLACERDMKGFVLENNDSTLVIKRRSVNDGFPNHWVINMNEGKERKIFITAPSLKAVHIKGSSDFLCNDTIDTEQFKVSISGSGDVRLAGVNAKDVDFSISGSGDIKAGLQNVEWSSFQIEGSCDMDIDFRDCNEAGIGIAGSGDVKLRGTLGSLSQKIAGSGDIDTKGLVLTGKKDNHK